MGNCFSGWHGRRSSRPYFDELPRLVAADISAGDPDSAWIIWRGVAVRLVRVSTGCCRSPRLICARCGRVCRVIYLTAVPCCYRCTGARYRTQSESPGRRAVRRAEKILRRNRIEPGRKEWKPKWMRWPTYERLSAAAEVAAEIIMQAEEAPRALLRRIEAMKPRRRGRPPKG